jgi:SAM-dependent methyltransferase
MDLTEQARRNRAQWDVWAESHAEQGRRAWETDNPTWGVWSVPESDLKVLDDVAGKDVLEAGCGTAYWSAWVARRGARVTGLDNSPRQLDTARALQKGHGLEMRLELGSAEDMPFADESFDIVMSEYGASIWCDPYLWIPEAARVLRPGGQLAFLVNSSLVVLCSPDSDEPAGETLLRPYFGIHRFEWTGDDSVEFHITHGKWIELLRGSGFNVEGLIEVQPPEAASPHRWTSLPTLEWARKWPSDEVWKARKRP